MWGVGGAREEQEALLSPHALLKCPDAQRKRQKAREQTKVEVLLHTHTHSYTKRDEDKESLRELRQREEGWGELGGVEREGEPERRLITDTVATHPTILHLPPSPPLHRHRATTEKKKHFR